MYSDVFFNLALLTCVGLGAVYDLLYRRIPNWLVLAAIGAGMVLNLARGGWWNVMDGIYGLLLGLVVGFLPFVLGFLGAGDVKFMGAMGAFLGVGAVPRMLFYAVLLGGVLALMSMAYGASESNFGRFFKETWRDLTLMFLSGGRVLPEGVKTRTHGTVPYGVAISGGSILAFYLDPAGKWAGF